ncbi:MAG: hypothetical protein AAF725_18755 [Acidobacteriota bacterium]
MSRSETRWKAASPKALLLAVLALGLAIFVASFFTGCGPEEITGTHLEYSRGRDYVATRDVRATVKEVRGVDGTELSLQLEARDPETGENLSFLVITPALEGEHEVLAFGRLVGWDSEKGYVRLVPVSSSCSTEGEGSSTLLIDAVDSDSRTLTGRFRVHVCGVETDHTWTLGEGRFQEVPY